MFAVLCKKILGVEGHCGKHHSSFSACAAMLHVSPCAAPVHFCPSPKESTESKESALCPLQVKYFPAIPDWLLGQVSQWRTYDPISGMTCDGQGCPVVGFIVREVATESSWVSRAAACGTLCAVGSPRRVWLAAGVDGQRHTLVCLPHCELALVAWRRWA